MALAERDAERARERERNTVDALEEARAYARGQVDAVVALMQRNKELGTKLATATAEGTRLRMQRDTYHAAQVAAEERECELLDVLAARGSALSSQGSPAGSQTARSTLEIPNKQ